MESTPWETVKRLFEHASELPPDERDVFLDAACAQDPELKKELHSILAVEDQAGGFFDSLARALSSAAPWSDPERPAATVDASGDLAELLREELPNRYEVVARIGRGGMAEVFRARDARHERDVAIKVLRPGIAPGLGTERFLREIKIAAKLEHPNILPLYDSGTANGIPYYVMPYVEEESLRDRLEREGPLPLEETVRIAGEVADALSFAHEHGVIHRDIKPGNILLRSGHAVVADFGIARAISEAGGAKVAARGVGIGTPAYVSPEQAAGAEVDGRTDIYSLACVAYEMVGGEAPFSGPTPGAILARKSAGEVRSLRVIRSSVPEPFEAAIMRALNPVPADRPGTVDEFLEELTGALAGRTSRARLVLLGAAIALIAGGAMLSAPAVLGLDPLIEDRVVVGSFENQTGDPARARLGNMVTYAVTEGLQRAGLGEIVPTETALAASSTVQDEIEAGTLADPIRGVALETSSGTIVSGSYWVDRDSLHFAAQVSRASGWSGLPFTGNPRVRLLHALDPVRVPVGSEMEAISLVRSRVMGALAVSGDETISTILEQGPALPSFEAYSAFSRGMELYADSRFSESNRHFREAYDLDPDFVTALLYVALNHWNLREYATADSVLRRVAVRRDLLSPYHRRWLEYRQALLAQDQPRALRAIRELAAGAPGSKAVYNHGIVAWENAYLSEAEAALKQLVPERGPMRGFVPYWGALATIQHQLGDYREALRTARRARERYPDLLWPVGWELSALAALGRLGDVEELVHQIETLQRDTYGRTPADVFLEAANELVVHGHRELGEAVWGKVLDWFETVTPGDPKTSAAANDRITRAEALIGLDRWTEAAAVADSLLSIDPDNVFYLGQAGLVAAARGDTLGARAISDRLDRLESTYLFGRHKQYQGLMAALLDQPARSVEMFREAFAMGRAYSYWVHGSPHLAGVRDYAPFQELMRPKE